MLVPGTSHCDSISGRFSRESLTNLSDLPDLDPVFVVAAAQQRLQVTSTLVGRRTIAKLRWQVLQDAQRNVTAGEAEPFEEESSCSSDTDFIRSPVVQSVAYELLNVPETFRGGLVEVLLGLNFLEDPGLDQSATSNHGTVNTRVLDRVVVVDVRQDITVTNEVRQAVRLDRCREITGIRLADGVGDVCARLLEVLDKAGAFTNVIPVRTASVALLSAAAVQSDGGDTRGTLALLLRVVATKDELG